MARNRFFIVILFYDVYLHNPSSLWKVWEDTVLYFLSLMVLSPMRTI